MGPFPTAGGTYTFDTSGPNPTLSGVGPSLTGVYYNGIAVFDFNAVTVGANQTFVGMESSWPLALLSQSNINVIGTIDVSGSPGFSSYSPVTPPPARGGPGGFGSERAAPARWGIGSNNGNVFGTRWLR